MIIRLGNLSHYLLPIYFYSNPYGISITVSILETILYIVCGYVAFQNLRVFLKIRMFHQNFIILACPMFGLWYEVVIGKFITMAYQLEFLKIGDSRPIKFYEMWTDSPEEMLNLESLRGLELLILTGFIQWHYLFSVIFGAIAHCVERAIASLLIDDYETNNKLYIPITLTFCTQFLAISISYSVLFDKIGIIILNILWITTCVVSITLFFWLKSTNERWLREMESPHRKRVFTISQRFQVKENIRALKLGKRLVFTVLGTMVACGTGIILVLQKWIPQYLCHFVENGIFLNPLWICPVFMYSLSTWKEEFQKAFPRRNKRKLGVIKVEQIEDVKKRISLETDIYFNQLNTFWSPQ